MLETLENLQRTLLPLFPLILEVPGTEGKSANGIQRTTLVRATFLLIVLIAGLALSSCVVKDGLRWQQIAEGEGYNIPGGPNIDGSSYGRISMFVYLGHKPRLIVISDKAAVGSLQDRVLPSHLRRIARTDFSANWVAVIYQGYKCRSGYSVQVSDVELDGESVTIHAQFLEPTDTDCLQQMGTSPYAVLRIRKPKILDDEAVSFIVNANGEPLPETCDLQGEYVPWRPLINDPEAEGQYEGRKPQLAILSSSGDLSSEVDDLLPMHAKQLSDFDFAEQVIGIVFQGRKETTGYWIEVIHMTRSQDTIHICAQLHEPRPKQPTGGAVTSPYYVFQFEKTEDLEGEFTFVLTDEQDGQRKLVRKTEVIH